jgi:hypothetical protein
MEIYGSGEFGELFVLIAVIAGVLTLVVHVAFAGAVWSDANELQQGGKGPALVGPIIWTLATLVGGLVSAGIYWVMHHSTLSRRG